MSWLKSKYPSYVSARRASRHAGTDVIYKLQNSLIETTLPPPTTQHEAELAIPKAVLDTSPPKFRMVGVAEDNLINLQYLGKSLKN